MTEKLGVIAYRPNLPDELYEYCKRVPAPAAKPSIPRVLSERGKIKLKFPWYSHQRRDWERR